jgi:hypothetical protein
MIQRLCWFCRMRYTLPHASSLPQRCVMNPASVTHAHNLLSIHAVSPYRLFLACISSAWVPGNTSTYSIRGENVHAMVESRKCWLQRYTATRCNVMPPLATKHCTIIPPPISDETRHPVQSNPATGSEEVLNLYPIQGVSKIPHCRKLRLSRGQSLELAENHISGTSIRLGEYLHRI